MDSESTVLLRADGVASYRYLTASFAVWTASFSMGTCYGYSAPAKRSMIDMDEFPVTEYDFQWLASILTLGGLFGGLTGGTFSEYLGRRKTLMIASIGLMMGWQTIICANCVEYLFYGRAMCGYWIGVISLVGPVYLSEVSPSAVRGRLSSAIQLFIVSGLLSMFLVASGLTWKWLALFGMFFAALTVVLLLMSVESPMWYFKKQRYSDATKSLLFLWGDCDQVTSELLRHDHQNTGPIASEQTNNDLFEIRVLKPIYLAILLMIAQQACGINAVVFYAEDIFHQAGTSLSAYACMVGFGAGQVIGSLLNMTLIDRFGRRFLLIASSSLVVLSLFTMTLYFTELKPSGLFGWVPLIVLSIYTIAFAIGLGPVAWVMMGELLPMKCRGYGSVLATSINWAGAFVVTNQWYNLQHLLTVAGAYAFLATISLILLIVFIVKLPETKGKSLTEIESLFVRLRRVNQSLDTSIQQPDELSA